MLKSSRHRDYGTQVTGGSRGIIPVAPLARLGNPGVLNSLILGGSLTLHSDYTAKLAIPDVLAILDDCKKLI